MYFQQNLLVTQSFGQNFVSARTSFGKKFSVIPNPLKIERTSRVLKLKPFTY
jgi:hypothetical protein